MGTVHGNGDLWVWDVETRETIDRDYSGHSGSISALAFSPDGSQIATASSDRTTRLWDVKSGSELLSLHGHSEDVRDVAFSPDGKFLVTASDDKTVQFYILDVGELIKLAKARVSRTLTQKECQKFLQMEECPSVP